MVSCNWWTNASPSARYSSRCSRARSRTAAAAARAGWRPRRPRRRSPRRACPSREAGTPAQRDERLPHRRVVEPRVAEHHQRGVGEDGPQQGEADPPVPHRQPVHADTAVEPRQPGHQQQLEQHQHGGVQTEELGDREHPVLAGPGGEEQDLDDHHVDDDERPQRPPRRDHRKYGAPSHLCTCRPHRFPLCACDALAPGTREVAADPSVPLRYGPWAGQGYGAWREVDPAWPQLFLFRDRHADGADPTCLMRCPAITSGPPSPFLDVTLAHPQTAGPAGLRPTRRDAT